MLLHKHRSLDTQSRFPATLLPLQETGAEVVAVEDGNWQEETKGLPGTQLSLHLLLRVVADIGIVGFPNAGGHMGQLLLCSAWGCCCCFLHVTVVLNMGLLLPIFTCDCCVQHGTAAAVFH